MHLNDWGTLSTISRNLSTPAAPVPYGNTVSYSDGPQSRSTGRLLFYLTLLDAAAYDLQRNEIGTLSVAEAQIFGSCGVTDPEVCHVALTHPRPSRPAALWELLQAALSPRYAEKRWKSIGIATTILMGSAACACSISLGGHIDLGMKRQRGPSSGGQWATRFTQPPWWHCSHSASRGACGSNLCGASDGCATLPLAGPHLRQGFHNGPCNSGTNG